ncbi:hypothetical protein FHS27_002630 [Rhodopirellula rubra]|uniref:Uncharacterized protein n=1 Tax=Aporhodopirellula rubra TaxID=980271 RepID=A0A7W5DZ76_9BACT|nr:hypothetical protein [Aporhodopirellula rubra]
MGIKSCRSDCRLRSATTFFGELLNQGTDGDATEFASTGVIFHCNDQESNSRTRKKYMFSRKQGLAGSRGVLFTSEENCCGVKLS